MSDDLIPAYPAVIGKAKRLVLESMRLLHLRGQISIVKRDGAWVITLTLPEALLPSESEGESSGSFRSIKKQAQRDRG